LQVEQVKVVWVFDGVPVQTGVMVDATGAITEHGELTDELM